MSLRYPWQDAIVIAALKQFQADWPGVDCCLPKMRTNTLPERKRMLKVGFGVAQQLVCWFPGGGDEDCEWTTYEVDVSTMKARVTGGKMPAPRQPSAAPDGQD